MIMKILITGGHVTPALSIVEKIQQSKEYKNIAIVYVGRKYALDNEKTVSLEYKEVIKKNLRFYSLQAGRLTRIVSFRTLRNILKIPLGFWQGFKIIRDENPSIILSFGGYIALPISFWGVVFKIPVYIQEQTIKPGLANRIIGLVSKKIFLSFNEAKKNFSPKKTIITGNPIRTGVLKTIKKPFEIKKNSQVIYVTGGSLGSHSINVHIEKICKKLLEKFIIIHQTGNVKEFNDYKRLVALKGSFPSRLRQKYLIKKHYLEDEIGYVYNLADIVVGRAGANTFFELIALGKPAIFIPLPWSAYKEQQYQSQIFEKAGVGEIFSQFDRSSNLLKLIEKVSQNIQRYRENFKNLYKFYKKDASEIIIKEIFKN